MKELAEFRIPEENASKHLPPDCGVRLSDGVRHTVRKLLVDVTDPMYARIGELQREYNSRDDSFHFGWRFLRRYTKAELGAAHAFQMIVKRTFEPAGAECGTEYDESTECPVCTAGATLASDLILDARSLHKLKDLAIARTIADEMVYSAAFVEMFKSNRLVGAEFRPVRSRRKRSEAVPGWYYAVITSPRVAVLPLTKTGIGPFDPDKLGEYRCPRGDLLGLNLLSELWLSQQDLAGSDIAVTKHYTGVRRGLLRPMQWLVCSARLRNVYLDAGLKGVHFEVAHLM